LNIFETSNLYKTTILSNFKIYYRPIKTYSCLYQWSLYAC